MDQSRLLKFRAGALFIAMVSLTACSSSQVDDADAPPPETAGDPAALDASTDAVPPPAGEDPSLAAANPDGSAPPADSNAAPPPGGDAPPAAVADAAPPPPAADPSLPEVAPMADAAPLAPAAPAITDAPPAPENNSVAAAEPAMPSSPPASNTNNTVAAGGDSGSNADSGEGVHYKVKHGDTLMKIAFENYGDLYRWKEIYEANRSRIQDPNHVPPGTQLTLNGAGMVTIERNGDQYLIKHGDTLGLISNSVYGTPRKWKKLWENNRQLIKDPNKIYAGFYLYYQPEGRLTHDQDGGADGEAAANSPQNLPFRNQAQPAVNTAANTVTQPAAIDPAAQQAAAPQAAAPTGAPAGAPVDAARVPASK